MVCQRYTNELISNSVWPGDVTTKIVDGISITPIESYIHDGNHFINAKPQDAKAYFIPEKRRGFRKQFNEKKIYLPPYRIEQIETKYFFRGHEQRSLNVYDVWDFMNDCFRFLLPDNINPRSGDEVRVYIRDTVDLYHETTKDIKVIDMQN